MIIVPIITTSLIHLSSKGWENVLFELGSERLTCLVKHWVVNQKFIRVMENCDKKQYVMFQVLAPIRVDGTMVNL